MKHYLDEIPLYAARQLEASQVSELEEHLKECTLCQEELTFWRSISGEIKATNTAVVPPKNLAEHALAHILKKEQIEKKPLSAFLKFSKAFQQTFNLLRAQSYLIRREVWPTSLGIMALGVMTALLSNHVNAIVFIAPMVAAANLAMLHSPENDPAYELVVATQTSSWKILLARLSIVSAFNLMITLVASFALVSIIPPEFFGQLILSWLAPMAFLSALALLLSIWLGTSNAIVISYVLWVTQYLQVSKFFDFWGFSLSKMEVFWSSYQGFWKSPGLLLISSMVIFAAALFSTRFSEHGLVKRSV
jgi:hypothetical protein